MIRTAKLLGAFALLFVTAACTSTFRADVVSFHQLARPQGERVEIQPAHEEMQGSLEFRQYADLVGERLRGEGFRPAEGSEPDIIAILDFGVSEGREVTRSRGYAGPYYGGFYHYGGFYSHPFAVHHYPFYSFYRPYGFGYGYAGDYTYTVYQRHVSLVLRQAGGETLYEGRAVSTGRSNNLPELMPLLVEALFRDFPGPSGETRRITIDMDDGAGSSY